VCTYIWVNRLIAWLGTTLFYHVLPIHLPAHVETAGLQPAADAAAVTVAVMELRAE
jgi:hypothetical protein